MAYTVQLKQSGVRITAKLIDALRRQGLQVTISFDLELVRADCVDCPYHGLMECTCLYTVLLVHDPKQLDGTYRTVTIHGRDETVRLTLLQSPIPHNGNTIIHEAVEAIIIDALLSLVVLFREVGTGQQDTQVDFEP